MKKMFFLILLAGAAPSAALELSLEENRGESGTVGYVDIDRVFKEYSGTLNAREEFLGEIKKKEGSVNQRKREIYVLKADIAKLRQEREFALTLPSLLSTQDQINSAKKPIVSTESAVSAQTAVPVPSSLPPSGAAVSTQAAISVTASTQAAISVTTSTQAAISVTASTAAVSTQTAPAASPPGFGIDMPGVSKVPVNYFKFSVSTAVPEIDTALIAKETSLKQKEEALKLYQRQVEKELLEYESHRSEILLGRIYIALKELAVKEEVSVIIDKRNILFGHSAVDLTDKLLRKLEEAQ